MRQRIFSNPDKMTLLPRLFVLVIIATPGVQCTFSSNPDVINLTPKNIKKLVLKDSAVWVVEFYTSSCDECKTFEPEFIRAAKAMEGIAKFGAVDADMHPSLCLKYDIERYPSIVIFIPNLSPHKNVYIYLKSKTAGALIDYVIYSIGYKAHFQLENLQ